MTANPPGDASCQTFIDGSEEKASIAKNGIRANIIRCRIAHRYRVLTVVLSEGDKKCNALAALGARIFSLPR
jgi:hypothetical protein